MWPRWRLLVALAALAFAGAVGAHEHLSDNAQVNQARALIEQGRNHAALQLLRGLWPLQHRPDMRISVAHKHDVWFLTGLASARAARQTADANERERLLRAAAGAFSRILLDKQNATRVRLELAHAYFLLGEDALAEEHFARVLATNPPAAMGANIERFLSVMRQRNDPWSGYFNFAIAPNSNVNRGTQNRIIYIFGLPFEIGEESRPESGTGLLLSGGGQYEARLGQQNNKTGRKWRWRFGADVSRTEYRGHEYDNLQASFRTGPRLLLSDTTEIGMQAHAGQVWSAKKRDHDFWGLSIAGGNQITRRLRLSADASWRYLAYRRAPASDGWRSSYGLRAGWAGGRWWRLDTLLGYSVARPQTINQRNRAFRISQDATFFLPWGWQLAAGAEWGQTHYEGASSSVPGFGAQRDRRHLWRASVLNARLVVAGFAPRLTFAREVQRSNSVFNDYNRNSAQLSVVKQF